MSLINNTPTGKVVRNGVVLHTASCISQVFESVPWWNFAQGGISYNEGKIKGLRIMGSDESGEFLNSRIIITRLSREEEGKNNQANMRRNMFLEAVSSRRQIGVLVNHSHSQLGEKLPGTEQFALMGFWVVTAAFVVFSRDEKNELTRTVKFRLDKVDLSDIWWRTSSQVQEEQGSHQKPTKASCMTCQKECYIIFKNTFVCGNLDCGTNKKSNNPIILPSNLEYDEAFLNWRPSMSNIMAAPTYLPPRLSMPQNKEELDVLMINDHKERAMWSGYLCQNCEALNQREHVSSAECHYCRHKQLARVPSLTFEDVSDAEYLDIKDSTTISNTMMCLSTSLLQPTPHRDYVVRRWKLHPEVDGYVMVLYPKKRVIEATKGAKYMYNELQRLLQAGELDYRRLPTKSTVTGQLTRWFGRNLGQDYLTTMKSSQTNISLDAAHQVFRDIISNLQDVLTTFTGQRPEFNELLTMCYFQNMGMGWHADGEEAIVGDVVSSQSLGSTAIMSFAVHPKVWIGRDLNNKINPDVPIFKDCPMYAERCALKQKFENGEIDRAEHQNQLEALLGSLKPSRYPIKCLMFPLPSGAIMVQKGPLINTWFQHKIEFQGPEARLRFVNTARYLSTKPKDVKVTTTSKKRKQEDLEG